MALSYTIFADINCTVVRAVANLYGQNANDILQAFGRIKGREVHEGDFVCGCRIDHIA